MTSKNKKKQDKDFSHVETDRIRATFIDNPIKQRNWGKSLNLQLLLKSSSVSI